MCTIHELPTEIVDEIICKVPLDDLFEVSKVSHMFKLLAYKHCKPITNMDEYEKAVLDGNILSLISHKNFEIYDIGEYLNLASESGHLNVTKYLATIIDPDELLIGFIGACTEGHENIINYFIDMEVFNWNSGLYAAYHGEQIKIAKLMFSKGADDLEECVNITNNIDMLKLLIDNGYKDFNHIFNLACQNGNKEIVEFMISKGVNNFNEGLNCACIYNHNTIVKLMISKGATKCRCGNKIEDH